jgi:hypothetical protein
VEGTDVESKAYTYKTKKKAVKSIYRHTDKCELEGIKAKNKAYSQESSLYTDIQTSAN